LVRKKLERSGSKRRIFSPDPEPSRSKKLRGRSGSVPSPLSSPLSSPRRYTSLSDGHRRHLPLLPRAPGRLPAAARRPSRCRAQVVFLLPRSRRLAATARREILCLLAAERPVPAGRRGGRLRAEGGGRLPLCWFAQPSHLSAGPGSVLRLFNQTKDGAVLFQFTLQPNKKQSRSVPVYQTQNRAAPFLESGMERLRSTWLLNQTLPYVFFSSVCSSRICLGELYSFIQTRFSFTVVYNINLINFKNMFNLNNK
jgi:hypothetical protein